MDACLEFSSVLRAAQVLRDVAHVTPVMTSRQLSAMTGGHVFLKCENFQRTGAFKFRGAYYALSRLEHSGGTKVVATLSSGNHGQAVALSAKLLGFSAHVIMPKPVSALKCQAIESYGGRVSFSESRMLAEEKLQKVLEQECATYVHAFNDFHVMAGQGTIVLELLDQIPTLDVLLAPVGGGGLLSGLCIAGHHLRPTLRIFACEPNGAFDALASMRLNRIVPMATPQTMADGLRTSLGTKTLPILRDHLSGVFSVSEEEIRLAMQFAFERLKMVIEPSAAVALAPLLRAQKELVGQRIGVVVTGGNTDLGSFGFPQNGST